jgi:AraC-like DNA-binding protein
MARPDITFLAGQSVRRCRHDIDKHFADYQTLQYMNGGDVALRIDQTAYHLSGRWFWSAYPGPRIAFHVAPPSTSWVHRYIAFRGPLVSRWMADGLFPIAPQKPPGGRDYSQLFDEMLRLTRQPGRWPALKAAHRIESMLIDLAEARHAAPNSPASESAPTWMNTATRELAASKEIAIDYDALAERLGMSVRTLRRSFRRRLGVSPHQYLIAQRVQAARELLLKTDVPLKEIARTTGYSDVFYFGRQFKQMTGVSPALFRRSREG